MLSSPRVAPAHPPRALAPALALALFATLTPLATPARASTPGSTTLSAGHTSGAWTGSITGAGSGENTCIDGVSCDSFQVTLAPGDYTGKQIDVSITWTIPAFDYDLYVHVGSLTGPELPASAGSPPSTMERVHIGIDPPVVTTPRTWWAHVQAATVPPGQTYNGLAALVSTPAAPTVTHLSSSLPFSHNVTLVAPATARTEEPSVRVDVRGNCYVGGIRGVPAGVDMWRFDLNPASSTFDPEMRNATYLGQPDVFQQMGAEDSTAGGADGGGDIDFCTSFPTSPDSLPVLTMCSLAVADVSTSVSSDGGTTWQHNAASAQIPSDDRQWMDSDGPNTVYLFYRGTVPSSALFVQKSTDHGNTYGPAAPVLDTSNPLSTTPGYIAVDHHNHNVYVSHHNSNALYVSVSTDGGTTWATHLVDGLTGHGHLFDPVKVGDDGTVYTAWSNDRHIYYSYSLDQGTTWTPGGVVENPDSTLVNVFPWLETGSAGRLDVVWFGTTSQNNSAAEWSVYFAQSLDANTATPTFRQQVVSDHKIHGSNISEGGLTGSANRNLGDYFQIAHDPQGAAVVAFADDHNDYDGDVYVTRQLAGPSLLAAANGNGTVQPVAVSPPVVYPLTVPEVVDPVHDAVLQLQPIPTDNPFDIVSIDYFCDSDGPNGPYLGARMKLSGLTAAPPNGLWRMLFSANAADGDGQLPYGVSDHGDMFYLLASDTSATPQFLYGTAYRDSMPAVSVLGAFAMAYNPPAGVADFGSIDTTTGTVTIKVAWSKLNALLPAGHAPIEEGRWIAGLRGAAGAIGRGPSDNTRGGRFNLFVTRNGSTGVDPGSVHVPVTLRCFPNPAPGAAEIQFASPTGGATQLAIYDVQGRLVRTLISGAVTPGAYATHWDGRGGDGLPAAGGIYFARLRSGGRSAVTRMVLVR